LDRSLAASTNEVGLQGAKKTICRPKMATIKKQHF